jgi:zinc protease
MRMFLVPSTPLVTSMVLAGALALPLLAVLGRTSSAAPADKTPPPAGSGLAFPFPVTERTLANGLRVYVVGYDSPGLVAF